MKMPFKGRKTYTLGFALIAYVGLSAILKQEADQNIINAILAGMGLTIRHGISNGKT